MATSNVSDLLGNWNNFYKANNIPDSVNMQRYLLKQLSAGLYPQAMSGVGYSNGLESQRRSANTQLINATNPANAIANIPNVQKQYDVSSANNANTAGLIARSQGFGEGTQAGAALGAASQGQSAVNNYINSVMSPEGVAKNSSAYYQAILSGMQNPVLNQILSLTSGTPASISSGDGWSSLLGSLIGLGSNYLTGGSSGRSSAASDYLANLRFTG